MAEADNKKPDKPDANRPEGRRQADNFVAKLVPDPANPPDLIRLSGYRGASSQEGCIRLYGNPELSIYWDIPEGDVLYEQAVPHDADPLGAVVMWIKRDSKLTSNLSQPAQGGQPDMFPGYTGAAAAPQGPNIQLTAPFTIPHSITPLCQSHYFYCPPSPPPLLCVSPIPHCPPHSPLVICNVSPLPYCVQPVSPTCPPTQPTTVPTTIPTTIQTGSPVAGPQAAPQGAGQQAYTLGATFGTHGTLPPSIFNCPSQLYHLCPTPSIYIAQCTIHNSLICNSPTPICVQPVSPTCTPYTPGGPSIPTSVDPGSPVAGGGIGGIAGGFQQAAPQAVSPQLGPVQAINTPQLAFSPPVYCYRPSPYIYQCTHSIVWWQCQYSPTPVCYYQQTPTPGPITPGPITPGPVTPGPGGTISPVAGGAGGGGAAQQAITYTITLPTRTINPTWPTIHTYPTIGPTYGPTWPPTHVTVTITPVTYQ